MYDHLLAPRLREALRRSSRHINLLRTVRLPRRGPPPCTLSPGDRFLFSNNVTTSVMPPRGPINTQEPSLCALISTLTLRCARVSFASGCPTQVCDAKIGMAWGQRWITDFREGLSSKLCEMNTVLTAYEESHMGYATSPLCCYSFTTI